MKWLSSGIKKAEQRSDEELLLEYRKSYGHKTISTLFDRYIHLVYGVCLKYLKDREEAQDATMQIFERLMQVLKDSEVVNFRPWLYTLAKNHCLMHLRKSNPLKTKNDLDLFMELHEEIHPLDNNEEEHKLGQLHKCIKSLKEQQRRCVELFYVENNNYGQIAVTTGYNIKQVKSFLQNGKRNIKICMEDDEKKA